MKRSIDDTPQDEFVFEMACERTHHDLELTLVKVLVTNEYV